MCLSTTSSKEPTIDGMRGDRFDTRLSVLLVSLGAGDGQDLGRKLFIRLLVALAIRVSHLPGCVLACCLCHLFL
jgi:hypothetical protein